MAKPPPTEWHNEREHRRFLAESAVNTLAGQTNAAGSVTLTASTATTVVTDQRVGNDSVITFMPKTANAAAEVGNGTMYISSRGKETFSITHANNAQTDRDYEYHIGGTGRGS